LNYNLKSENILKSVKISASILLFITFFSYSCELYNRSIDISLYEIKILADTTIIVNDSLNLDIREYYKLREINPYDNYPYTFIGFPYITPEIDDTSIAHVNYNYIDDTYGENFSILGLKAGETSVILHFSWDDCNNTVVSKEDKNFKLTVVEK